jgi:hypothetical protein
VAEVAVAVAAEEAETMTLDMKQELFERLSPAVQTRMEQLAQYDAPFLEEKLKLDGTFPMEQYGEAFVELKKYVGLAFLFQEPLDMPSRTVDDVWHQFILFTREYHDFSKRFYGKYFHHSPYLPSRQGDPTHLDNLVRRYHQTYGRMPEIWSVCEHKQKEMIS